MYVCTRACVCAHTLISDHMHVANATAELH